LACRSIVEATALGVKTIYISGGEPFLYSELPDVLSVAAIVPCLQVVIATNGTFIGKDEAILLKRYGVSAQVSMDGPEIFHDAFRGCEGAFKRTAYGIQHLVSSGVPVNVVITICKDNMTTLPWLADWSVENGVREISVQPLLKLGRGNNIRSKALSDEQLCDLFLQISDLGYRYESLGLRFRLSHRTRRFLLEHPCAAYICLGQACHRGVQKEIKKLVVREDGTVLPEIPTLHDRYAIGNLNNGSLGELVNHYLDDGYESFHRLCQTVYHETLCSWQSPLIPWDELISRRSFSLDGEMQMEAKLTNSSIGLEQLSDLHPV
jgi:MoaA/NifB/PqqE/SkfB family radical SAM enzyme